MPAGAGAARASSPRGGVPSARSASNSAQLLVKAQRPIAIVGGSGWTPDACADLQRFVENWQLPVGLRVPLPGHVRQPRTRNYAGDVGIGINPALAQRIRDADLVLAIGPRLGETTTGGYTLLDIPKTKQTLVHVHQGAEEFGRVYSADLPIVSGMPELAALLAALQPAVRQAGVGGRPRRTHAAPISTGARRARSRATCRWAK